MSFDAVLCSVQVQLHGEAALTLPAASGIGSKRRSNATSLESHSSSISALDLQPADTKVATGSGSGRALKESNANAAKGADESSRGHQVHIVVSGDGNEWKEEQELALVQALKQFGKEVPNRWDMIAASVEGKNKVQCFKHFKELRNVFRGDKDIRKG